MLYPVKLDYKIILGSQSPRRAQLLREMGLDFTTRIIPIEEVFVDSLSAMEQAEYLAQQKAAVFEGNFSNNELILTADSVVVFGELPLAKPESREEAIQMIGQLQGCRHAVVTGLCLKTQYKVLSASDISYVDMLSMSPDEISYYVDTYSPYDKAGSYGIQEWIGHCKISAIHGSYTNIMGLPTHLLYQMLQEIQHAK